MHYDLTNTSFVLLIQTGQSKQIIWEYSVWYSYKENQEITETNLTRVITGTKKGWEKRMKRKGLQRD